MPTAPKAKLWQWVFAAKLGYPLTNAHARDKGSILGSGRSRGEGNGNPLQYFCLENPVDSWVWQATVYGVTQSEQLSMPTPMEHRVCCRAKQATLLNWLKKFNQTNETDYISIATGEDTQWQMQNGTTDRFSSLFISYIRKHSLTQSNDSAPRYLLNLKTYVHRKTFTWMFTAVSFINVETWTQLSCCSVGEWVNCDTSTQWTFIRDKKKELSIH